MKDLLAMLERGDGRSAVREFNQRIAIPAQPIWAARILEAFRSRLLFPPEVEDVLEIAFDSTRWAEAHDAFTRLRERTLAVEKNDANGDLDLLLLAEWVAKVTFNASEEDTPFKPYSGLAVAGQALRMAGASKSLEFQAQMHWLVNNPNVA